MPLLPIAGMLAPVPLDHLADGQDVCRDEGKVAFGTRASWETFNELQASGGVGAPVLIYASRATERNLGPVVSWRAQFVGWVPATMSGGHYDGARYRPPSTRGEDDKGYWLGFWEVADLAELAADERITIDRLHDRKGSKYAKNFVPEGPILLGSLG